MVPNTSFHSARRSNRAVRDQAQPGGVVSAQAASKQGLSRKATPSRAPIAKALPAKTLFAIVLPAIAQLVQAMPSQQWVMRLFSLLFRLRSRLRAWLVGALLLLTGAPVFALDVVATAPSMGALVREVAGERADLQVLAGPNRDLHALQLKPSMIHALRAADLVVAIGAELEVGWLVPAIERAANPDILPGAPGYFEAAAQVPLLDAGRAADRALGDVHPSGNPHINMDPVRMAAVAEALAERLALLDPAGAATYRSRAATFSAQVDRQMTLWQPQLRSAPGVVLHHRNAIYLLDRFNVP